MKKVILLLLVAAILVPAIAVCTTINIPGVYVCYSGNNMFIYTFRNDMTVSYTIIYDYTSKTASTTTLEGKWSEKGTDISLQIEGGTINLGNITAVVNPQTIALSYVNGALVQNSDGAVLVKVSDSSTIDSDNGLLSGTWNIEITIEGYGTLKAELYADIAPITVTNFIKLVNEGFYDGLTFHRIISGFMIQGGDPLGNGTGGSEERITGEFTANGVNNPLKHTRGVLSMARSSSFNSASSQFFIMHQDAPHLDGQYAAFGKVTEGIEIVDAICANTPVTDKNGTVTRENQPVIKSIRAVSLNNSNISIASSIFYEFIKDLYNNDDGSLRSERNSIINAQDDLKNYYDGSLRVVGNSVVNAQDDWLIVEGTEGIFSKYYHVASISVPEGFVISGEGLGANSPSLRTDFTFDSTTDANLRLYVAPIDRTVDEMINQVYGSFTFMTAERGLITEVKDVGNGDRYFAYHYAYDDEREETHYIQSLVYYTPAAQKGRCVLISANVYPKTEKGYRNEDELLAIVQKVAAENIVLIE